MTPSPAIHRTMTAAEWTMLLVLSVLWGGSFFFVGIAVHALPPLTIVLLRVTVAAIALLAMARIAGVPLPRGTQVWVALAVVSLLNNVAPFTLIVFAQTRIPSGLASILNATTPLFTVLVAHVWTSDEKLTAGRVAGVLLGFLGVAVLLGGTLREAASGQILAELACLVAALSYAFAGVYGRRFRAMGVPPLATAAGTLTMSTVYMLPLALLVDRPWSLPVPPAGALASVVALGLLSTAVAYVLYYRILATAGATNLLLVTLLIPVSAILLGAVFLDETLSARQLAGMALIALGLAAIDGRPLTAARRAVGAA
jgi:drug/metabolite transporter (DMT)-like permease